MKKHLQRFSKQIIQMMGRMLILLACLGFFGMSAFATEPVTVTPASRCGIGTLVLHASTSLSGTIKWYTVPFY